MSPKNLLPLVLIAVVAIGGYLYFTKSQPTEVGGLSDNAVQEGVESGSKDAAPSDLVASNADPMVAKAEDAERSVIPVEVVAKPDDGVSASLTIAGTVLDENGAALEGVGVRFEKLTAQVQMSKRTLTDGIAAAVTDGAGKFELRPNAKDSYKVTFHKSGYITQDETITVADGATALLDEIRMPTAMVLEGRILDEGGAGIAGVEIHVPQEEQNIIIIDDDEGGSDVAVTEADGSFRLDTLKPGPWRLWLHSNKHRDRILTGELPVGLRMSGLLWTLEDGLTIRGRVTGIPMDETRKLFIRAETERHGGAAKHMGADTSGFILTPNTIALASDATFELPGLHPGAEYSLGLYEESEAKSLWMNPSANLSEAKKVPSEVQTADLVWAPMSTLKFQLVEAGSKTPIEKMELNPDNWEMMGLIRNQSDEAFKEGKVVLEGIPASHSGFKLTIDSDGYEGRSISDIQLMKGQETDLGVIELEPGSKFKIQVVEAGTGKPIRRARVTVRPATGGARDAISAEVDMSAVFRSQSARERTDDEGMAEVQYFPESPNMLSITHKDYAEVKLPSMELSAYRNTPLIVELSEGGTIVATVLDAYGEPVTGVEVLCDAIAAPSQNGGNARVMVASSVGMPSAGKKTNAKGVVRFERLTPGDYDCSTVLPQDAPTGSFVMVMDDVGGDMPAAELKGIKVTALEGEEVTVQLQAPTEGVLEGYIREDGAPLVGASVRLEKEGGGDSISHMFGIEDKGVARTNAKGYYRLEGIKPGKKTLSIKHDMRAMPAEFALEILEGDNTASYDMVVSVVSGRVTDPNGKPIEGARVTVEKAREEGVRTMSISMSMDSGGGSMVSGGMGPGRRKPVMTDEDGRFRLRGVLAGQPIMVHASKDGWQNAKSDRLTLPEGAVREGLQLKMTAAGSVKVTVLNEAGEPRPFALARATWIPGPDGEEAAPGGDSDSVGVTDDSGVATLQSLAPGKYEISLQGGMPSIGGGEEDHGPDPEPVTVEVVAGKATEVTLKP